jgi:hypothetical protein
MHRLTLSATELSLLAAHAGVALPPGLLPPQPPAPAGPDAPPPGANAPPAGPAAPPAGPAAWPADPAAWPADPAAWPADPAAWPATADAVLRRRGLVDGDGTLVPAVAANLTVLAAPAVTVRIEVTLPHRARTSLFTVSGGLSAALRQLDDGELELALFPAWELGTELTRAVPDLPEHASTPDRDTVHAYAPQAGAPPVVTGRDRPPAPRGGALGALLATVTGADGTAAGTVEWLATGTGWLGLESVPGHGGAPGAAVHPSELASWLAPALDSALAAIR